MVVQGTIGRFARWGLTHGPVWGTLAALIGAIPLSRILPMPFSPGELLVLGALCGLIGGPALAILVGAVCLAADRVPRWILDAPDYVAVLTVVGAVAMIAWPALRMADAGTTTALLGVALLATAPTIDAARTAPRLLHPRPAAPDHPQLVGPSGHAGHAS